MHKIGAYIVPTFIIYVHLIFIYISYYTDTSYMYMYDILFFAYTYIYVFSHFLLSIFFGEESLYSPIFKKKTDRGGYLRVDESWRSGFRRCPTLAARRSATVSFEDVATEIAWSCSRRAQVGMTFFDVWKTFRKVKMDEHFLFKVYRFFVDVFGIV